MMVKDAETTQLVCTIIISYYAERKNSLGQAIMANHCAFSFNHDYFHPTDSRSIVSEAIRPIVDRQSADILPNFGSFFCRPM